MELIVSAPPFIKTDASANKILWSIVGALSPAIILSAYVFGLRALLVFFVSIATAVTTEAIIQKFSGKRITIVNGGAVITGILLALLLPYSVPLWIPMVGAIFAIAIVKEAFGGAGYNIFNPALAGWVFLMMSWAMYTVTIPGPVHPHPIINYNAIRLAEVSPIVLMVTPLYLLGKGYMDWRIPFGFLGSTLLFLLLLRQSFAIVFTGIFVLGIFFFATDPVTTPVTKRGRLIFGVGCGILTVLYAIYASYVEGIGLSILLMNAVTPLIDRFTRPKPIIAEDLYEDLR